MSDHASQTESDRHPVQTLVSPPAVEHISQAGVDEADAQSPKSHFGLFDSAVAARKEDDDVVCEDAGEVAEDTADEGGEEHEAGGCGGEVVGFVGHDFGD